VKGCKPCLKNTRARRLSLLRGLAGQVCRKALRARCPLGSAKSAISNKTTYLDRMCAVHSRCARCPQPETSCLTLPCRPHARHIKVPSTVCKRWLVSHMAGCRRCWGRLSCRPIWATCLSHDDAGPAWPAAEKGWGLTVPPRLFVGQHAWQWQPAYALPA